MAKVCDLTGKKVSTGHAKKHQRGSSGGGGAWKFKAQKTKRTWEPNLRKIRAEKDGIIETLTVSMKAYKRLRDLLPGETFKGYKLVKNY